MMHPADAAGLGDVPDLTEGFPVRLRRALHFQRLEAVLPAVIAWMTAGNSFCAFLRDLGQVSFRGSSDA